MPGRSWPAERSTAACGSRCEQSPGSGLADRGHPEYSSAGPVWAGLLCRASSRLLACRRSPSGTLAHRMTRSPFTAGLLSCSVALQLALAGLDGPCRALEESGHRHGAASTAAVVGEQDVPHERHGADAAAHSQSSSHRQHEHGRERAPCEQRGRAHGCPVAAHCTGFSAALVDDGKSDSDAQETRIAMPSVATPASYVAPPDLPPPRA